MNQQIAQILKQLQAIWTQLGLNQRITIAAATLAVLVGLGSLGFWSSRPSYSLLYGKLDESEAAKVVAFLDEAKVSYQVRAGDSIYVPTDKVHSTRMQLASKGLPKGEGVGFEIFDRSNFGISDFVQRANYLRAVQGELARTIGQVDSIEMARVMIVMPENRLLISDKNKPTASVFVKVRGNAQLPQQNVNAIRFLVANSVEGLQPNHVSVVDNLGNVLSDSLEPDSVVGMTQTQLEVRKKLEQYLSKKAEGMLDTVLGPGNSVVRVAADINFDSMTREEVKFDPESQVKRIETTTDENTDSTNPSPSGVPGVTVNANGETNSLSTISQNSNRMRKKVTSNQYEISKITSNLVQAAGSVSRLSAAVFVAAKTEGTGANRKTVTRTKEELDKIRKIVQSALGIQEGTQSPRKDEITLEEFPFNDQTTTELTTTLQKDQSRQFWIQMVQTAIYPILALAVLVVLLKLFKRAPDVDIPVGVPVGEGTTYVNGQTPNATTNGKEGTSVRTPSGVVTVEVLNQLIRENPQNMTQAIRGDDSRTKQMNEAEANPVSQTSKLTKVQKLALLLIILGPETASQILKNLDEHEMEAVSLEISKQGLISQQLQMEILREFSQVAVEASTSVRGGMDYTQQTLEKAIGTYKAANVLSRVAPTKAPTVGSMQKVVELETRQIFNLIKQEQPQTIALIVSYLPSEKASQVLHMMKDEQRQQVVERLATLSPTPIEVVEKVVEMLVGKMSAKPTRALNQTGGVKSAADLLNALDKTTSKTILSAIEERNPDLGASIRKKMFTFEDLALIDLTGLQKIMREVDIRDLAVALKTASEQLKKTLLGAISRRAAETVEEEMSFLGSIKLKEIEAAQMRIIDVVRRLETEGEVELDNGKENQDSVMFAT